MGIQHERKEIVANIVVFFTDNPRTTARLQIKQAGAGNTQYILQISRHLLVEFCFQDFAEQNIEAFTVPPAFHIAFAKPQGTLLQHPFKETGMMKLNVPGAGTIDLNICLLEQLFSHSGPVIICFIDDDSV